MKPIPGVFFATFKNKIAPNLFSPVNITAKAPTLKAFVATVKSIGGDIDYGSVANISANEIENLNLLEIPRDIAKLKRDVLDAVYNVETGNSNIPDLIPCSSCNEKRPKIVRNINHKYPTFYTKCPTCKISWNEFEYIPDNEESTLSAIIAAAETWNTHTKHRAIFQTHKQQKIEEAKEDLIRSENIHTENQE